jgi:hypothetical protein
MKVLGLLKFPAGQTNNTRRFTMSTETAEVTATEVESTPKAGRKPNPETLRRNAQRASAKENIARLTKIRKALGRAESELAEIGTEMEGATGDQVAQIFSDLQLSLTVVDAAINENATAIAQTYVR